MDEEENPDATVNLLEQLDKQEWQRKQEQQASGQGFDSFYGALCDRIRKENLLDSIIEEFEVGSSAEMIILLFKNYRILLVSFFQQVIALSVHLLL